MLNINFNIRCKIALDIRAICNQLLSCHGNHRVGGVCLKALADDLHSAVETQGHLGSARNWLNVGCEHATSAPYLSGAISAIFEAVNQAVVI